MAKKTDNQHCLFCGRSNAEVPFLLQGMYGYICPDCIKLASEYLEEVEGGQKKGAPVPKLGKCPKPAEIKAYLDQESAGRGRVQSL